MRKVIICFILFAVSSLGYSQAEVDAENIKKEDSKTW